MKIIKHLWTSRKTEIFRGSLITVFLLIFTICSCCAKENENQVFRQKSGGSMKTYISVSMSEGLKMYCESKNAVLLDVRRPEEYQMGHIPGAVLLTNETMTAEKAANLIPSKNTEVFVYCRSGRRSKEASKKLCDYGYEKVVEIGGILDYSGQMEK